MQTTYTMENRFNRDPIGLENVVHQYLDSVMPQPMEGKVTALISPHGGYDTAGSAAAHGYRLVDPAAVRRVFILAPTHQVRFRGVSIPDKVFLKSPLGPINIDREACNHLMDGPLFDFVPEAHGDEYPIAYQLPFLQAVLGGFQIVPLVVGQLHNGDHEIVAHSLKKQIGKHDLVIASSDFTHQGKRYNYAPFATDIRKQVGLLDMGAIELILRGNTRGLMDYIRRTGATICGVHTIGILMELLSRESSGKVQSYYTSGDINGNDLESVSFASIAFSSPEGWA